jgi:hypothetical protein
MLDLDDLDIAKWRRQRDRGGEHEMPGRCCSLLVLCFRLSFYGCTGPPMVADVTTLPNFQWTNALFVCVSVFEFLEKLADV